MSNPIEFLRTEESYDLMRAEKDIITLRLLTAVRFYRAIVLHEENKWPIKNLDMLFLMQVLQMYFHDHHTLECILEGAIFLELCNIDECSTILLQDVSLMPRSKRLIQIKEAIECIELEENTIAKQLLISVHYYMCKAVNDLHMEPIEKFDYLFFIQSLQPYFRSYEIMKIILSGEELSF